MAITLREACLQASSQLSEAGVEEPRANAELLMMHLLGLTRAQLLRDAGEPLPAEQAQRWAALVRRRAAGEPVQYIIGEQWFYGLELHVTPAVLIPRPETELLVEAVLEEADRLWPSGSGSGAGGVVRSGTMEPPGAGSPPGTVSGSGTGMRQRGPTGEAAKDRGSAPTAVDVGTGSGAIAVALATQRPQWDLVAIDLSADALDVARANAAHHELAGRIDFVQGDLLGPLLGESPPVDIVVSNPPYIPAGDLATLQREVREHEPRLALDGGADGLDPYRRLVGQLLQLAELPRLVALEVGKGQARDVARLLEACTAWSRLRIVTDYAGIERHVIAVRE
nr:HemK/PrmC family methyltransferase [Paenibacillus sabuli]